MSSDDPHLVIYCDGSYLLKRKSGAWAAITPQMHLPIGGVVHKKQSFPVNSYTIELLAVIRGLEGLAVEGQRVVVYTDCQPLIESKKDPLPCYQGLWKELHDLVRRMNLDLSIRWVKGHHKSMHNKIVDRHARLLARSTVGGQF